MSHYNELLCYSRFIHKLASCRYSLFMPRIGIPDFRFTPSEQNWNLTFSQLIIFFRFSFFHVSRLLYYCNIFRRARQPFNVMFISWRVQMSELNFYWKLGIHWNDLEYKSHLIMVYNLIISSTLQSLLAWQYKFIPIFVSYFSSQHDVREECNIWPSFTEQVANFPVVNWWYERLTSLAVEVGPSYVEQDHPQDEHLQCRPDSNIEYCHHRTDRPDWTTWK